MFGFKKKNKGLPPVDERLSHIAFIMDGNGRWAQNKGLPREYGHKAGAEAFRRVIRLCGDAGIKAITVYAFSTENWSRPEREVRAIMELLDEYIREAERTDEENGIRYVFLGDKQALAPDLRTKAEHLETLTRENKLLLNIALNYGGRAEITTAVNQLIKEGYTSVTEADIASHLYTSHCADPDLIVRTANEYRLSNFLLWQAAYSEFYFTPTLWPDFGEEELGEAIRSFYARKRKFGGLADRKK